MDLEQDPALPHCPGIWDISHCKTCSVHGKFDFFFFPGIVHSVCLFGEGHETRRQACLLLKESIFVTNMFEKPFKNNPFFFSERLLCEAAKAIETRAYQSCMCGLWKIKLMRDTSCI